MLPLLRSEWFRLRHRWMPRILLVILIALVGLSYVALWTALRAQPDAELTRTLRANLRLAAVRDMGLQLVVQIGTINVVILTASLIGSEFGWGTIRTLLPRARSRSALLAAKLITAVLFIGATVVVGTVVALGASALVTVLEDLPRGLGPDGAARTLAAVGRSAFVMMPYLELTFLATVLTRSMAAGIGIGLVIFFLEGLLMTLLATAGGVFERLPGAVISRNVEAVMAANRVGLEQPFTGGDALPSAPRAALILTLYTVAFLALAFHRFRSCDITVGS